MTYEPDYDSPGYDGYPRALHEFHKSRMGPPISKKQIVLEIIAVGAIGLAIGGCCKLLGDKLDRDSFIRYQKAHVPVYRDNNQENKIRPFCPEGR
jgi:type II restriction/modification system DNA methylase subunit YeeA